MMIMIGYDNFGNLNYHKNLRSCISKLFFFSHFQNP